MDSQAGVTRRLFINVALNFGAQAIVLGINFLSIPFIVHRLGPEFYGIVVLVQTLAAFSGVINAGIGRALTKYVAELYWKEDRASINRLFQTALATCLLAGMAAIIFIVAPGRSLFTSFIHGGPELTNGLISLAIEIAALTLFSTMLIDVIAAIPLAAQRFGIRNALQLLINGAWCFGSVALLATGHSVRSMLVLYLVVNVAGVAAYTLASRRIIPGLKFRPRFDGRAFRKLIMFSVPITISSISALIVVRLDRLILAYYLPLAAVTFYTLPYSLSEKLTAAVSSVTSVVFPFASELHSMSAYGEIHDLYLRATKTLTLMVLPLTVVFVSLPWEILRFWLGKDYAMEGALVLSLLGVSSYINSLSAIPTMIWIATGRVWTCAAFALATSAVNLLANLYLIPRYGIIGSAWALVISQIFVIPFLYLVNRSLGISQMRFFRETLMRPFVCATLQFALLYEIRGYITDLFDLLMVCLISLLAFGVAAFLYALTGREREGLSASIRQVLRAVAIVF